MKLTSEMIKQKAAELGLDDVGIASIDRFKDAPLLYNPLSYFPEAKSVIVTVMRIPRGTYRGIEEGTHWHNYTYYAYNRLNTLFRPRLTYALSCFVEDHGWEAVPHYPGVPERNPVTEPVAPGKPPRDINASVRILAAGAGVGEIGHAKVFLSPKFGPRVRLGSIFTDAELEPDPILEPGSVCNKCGRCVKDCPGNAIPPIKDKDKRRTIKLGEKEISWGDVDMGRCTLTHHGFNNTISPFHKKDFPNLEYDAANAEITEEEAYRLCYPMARAKWSKALFDESDGSVMHYYDYVMNHVGYFAVCGARGCIRACMDNLEKSGRIENKFHNTFYKKEQWLMSYKKEDKKGEINPFREEYLDREYPGIRKGEQ